MTPPLPLRLATLAFLLTPAVAFAAAPATQPAPLAPGAVIFSESFDDADLGQRGWYDGDRFRIAADAHAGKGCIEYDFPQGATAGQGSKAARRLFEPTDELFLRFYLRLSKDFGWTGKNFHPHLVHFLTTENHKFMGPAKTHLTLYCEPVDGKLRLAATDIENNTAPHGLTQGPLKGAYNGKLHDSKARLFTGNDKWHCIEAHYKLNTLDLKNDRPNADGVVQGWFDGELVIDRADVVFRSTDFPNMKWNQFVMSPYFGPGLLPKPQTLWIDEMVVATQRVGPLKSATK